MSLGLILLVLLMTSALAQVLGDGRDGPGRSRKRDMFGDYMSSFFSVIEKRFQLIETNLSALRDSRTMREMRVRLYDLEARMNSNETQQRFANLERGMRNLEAKVDGLLTAKLDAAEQRLKSMVEETSNATEQRLAALEKIWNETKTGASVCRYQYQYKFQTLASSQAPADPHRLERLEGELSRLQERLAAISTLIDVDAKGMLVPHNASVDAHDDLLQRLSSLVAASEEKIVSLLQVATEFTARNAADVANATRDELARRMDNATEFSKQARNALQAELLARLDNITVQILQAVTGSAPNGTHGWTESVSPHGKESTCHDFLANGHISSGVYSLHVDDGGEPMDVFCDMTTDGGGWTVFQRRMDGSVDFFRNWTEYENGFGNLVSEFWLGNRNIHRLTSAGQTRLRVDLEGWNSEKAFAIYSHFSVGDTASDYLLSISGYSGTAGDGLAHNDNHKFSTPDKDHDALATTNCAMDYHSGSWWYGGCTHANLNGLYGSDGTYGNKVVFWDTFHSNRALRLTEMKLR